MRLRERIVGRMSLECSARRRKTRRFLQHLEEGVRRLRGQRLGRGEEANLMRSLCGRKLPITNHLSHLRDPNLLLPCWGRKLYQIRVNTTQDEPSPMLIRREERSRQPPSLRLPVHAMRNEKEGRDRASFLLVRQKTRFLHDERGYHRAGMDATIAERAIWQSE
jgi:hypothetical protein